MQRNPPSPEEQRHYHIVLDVAAPLLDDEENRRVVAEALLSRWNEVRDNLVAGLPFTIPLRSVSGVLVPAAVFLLTIGHPNVQD